MVILGWRSKYREYSWLILFVVLAAVLYSGFSWGLPWRFNSPDESANAYFAQRLAQGQSLAVPAELNDIAANPIVHPRSTQVVGGQLTPASFLGLPLIAGFIGRLAGIGVLPYLTPLGAIMGLLCFFGIVCQLADNKAAWIASLLLATTPAWWYYHSRPFFHNALFFDFLLLAIYLLFKALKSKNGWLYLGSGLALGLALSLRTSEIFWLTISGVVWLGLSWRQVRWSYLPWLVLGVLISFSPIFLTNYQIYGSIFSIGYRDGLQLTPDIQQTLGLMQQLMLPFGFHPRIILTTATNYLVKLTWWWTVLAGLGLGYMVFVWRKQTKQAQAFASALLLAVIWLVVVYGSWQFNDNPDPSAVTLGTSYVRYWLPIYGLLLWPAGLFLRRLLDWKWGKEALLFIVGGYAVLSGLLVWWQPAEGLQQIRANIKRFQVWGQEVGDLTEPDSVIVTGLTDKIFWPERQVVYGLVNPADYVAVARLLQTGLPVYWFHPTWRQSGLEAMNSRLNEYGMLLTTKQTGWQDFSLYQFSLVP